MVGLRWARKVREEDGKEEWSYICRVDESKINQIDKTLFWGSQVLAFIFWFFFTVINVISLSANAVIDAMAGALIFINLYHYFQCSREQQSRMKTFMESAQKRAGNAVVEQAVKNLSKK